MYTRINQFMVLAGHTALETIRQPICLILLLSCLGFMALLPVMLTHTFGEGIKLIRDSALALHLVSGLILGAIAACSTLAHEIRRGTAAAVLSKPVNRELFFTAKYAGIVMVLLLYSLAFGLCTLLGGRTVRSNYILDLLPLYTPLAAMAGACLTAGIMNYYFRRPFSSNAFVLTVIFLLAGFVGVNFFGDEGALIPFGSLVPWEIIPASLLVTMAILVLSAIAVSLATRLDVVPTLSLCSLFLLGGLMSDYLFGRMAAEAVWARILHGGLPNWQHFWMTDALGEASGIPWSYLADAGLYAGLYVAAVLCLGMVAFRHMDVRA